MKTLNDMWTEYEKYAGYSCSNLYLFEKQYNVSLCNFIKYSSISYNRTGLIIPTFKVHNDISIEVLVSFIEALR